MKWLSKLLPSRPAPTPETRARWVDARDTPFAVDLVDCSEFAGRATSATGDAAVAESYARLRASDGSDHAGHDPQNPVTVPCDLSYAVGERGPDGPVFRASCMEEKWDLSLFGDRLYCSRSWTGELWLAAEVAFEHGRMRVDSLSMNGDTFRDPGFAVAAFDFLVRSHVLGEEIPSPLPAGYPPQADRIAILTFTLFGRRSRWATYADTTRIAVTHPPPESPAPLGD
jgi:hypothetical protein